MGAILAKERVFDVPKRSRGASVPAVSIAPRRKAGLCDTDLARMTRAGLARDMCSQGRRQEGLLQGPPSAISETSVPEPSHRAELGDM